MIYCPNKNSKEFQDLASSVGENRAYFLWNKYKGEVPDSYFTKNELISISDINFNKDYFIENIENIKKEKANGSKNIGLYSFKDKFVKLVKSKRKLSKENLNTLRDRVSDMDNVYPALEIIDLPNGSQAIVMDKANGKIGNELSESEINEIPQAHWDKFEKTIRELSKRGIQTDLTKRSNVLYDKNKGFQFIDLEGASIEGDATNKFFKKDDKEFYYDFEKYPFFPRLYKSAKQIFTDIGHPGETNAKGEVTAKFLTQEKNDEVSKNFITPEDKIIWGTPTIGKSFLRKNNDSFLDMDEDYKDFHNEMREFVVHTTEEEYQELLIKNKKEIKKIWDSIKKDAKSKNKPLYVSARYILDLFSEDFDKVIVNSKETFIKRNKERFGNLEGMPENFDSTKEFEDWKNSIDKSLLKINSNKIIQSEGYLEDTFQPYTNQITYSQALEKARELLPDFKEEDLAFITKEAMFGETGRTDVMGMYTKGAVFIIDKDGKGTVQEYIVRHELFHKIFTEYLTSEEQKLVINKLGSEEDLAIAFQSWKNQNKEVSGKLKTLFTKILRFLGLLKVNASSIDSFFKQIESQNFTIKKQKSTSEQKYISKIQKAFESSETLDSEGRNTTALENYHILNDRFIKNFNRFTEIGLPFNKKNTSSYIITGHNEIQKLILSQLDSNIKNYTDRINTINETLKNNLEGEEKLLSERRELVSKRAFDRMYYYRYNFLYTQSFPNKLTKFKDNTSDIVSDYDIELSEDDNEEFNDEIKEKGQAFFFQEEVYNSIEKTSNKVKTIASNIYDPQRNKYLSWGESYSIMLQLLNDVPAQNFDKWISLVKKRVEGYNKSSYKAVLSKLEMLRYKATTDRYVDKHGTDQTLPTNAKFLNLDNSFGKEETFLLVLDKDFDISKIERQEDIDIYLTSKSIPYKTVIKKPTDPTRTFITNILIKIEELNREDLEEFQNNVNLLNNLRVKQYYTQALTELLQNLISQKENNRLLGIIETTEKGTNHRYYSALRESIEQATSSDIIDKLSKNFYTSSQVKAFIAENKKYFFDEKGREFTKVEDKLEAIKKILNALGFEKYNYSNISNYTKAKDLYGSLKYFLFGDDKKDGTISRVGVDDYEAETSLTFQETIGSILQSENTTIRRLGNFLRFNLENDRPGMSKRVDGKMVYNFTPSSNGMDILRRLSKNNYLNKNDELPYEAGFEYLQTDYFKLNPYNPFNKDTKNPTFKKQINDVYIHDGISITSTYGKGKTIEIYTKEDLEGFINRTFNQGFLTTLNNSPIDSLEYIQFSSPVSNRPNIPGVKIELVSNTEFDNMLDLVLKQIVARPEFDNVQNYDRNKIINFDKLNKALIDLSKNSKYNSIYKLVETKKDVFEDRFYLENKHIEDKYLLQYIKDHIRKSITDDAKTLFKQVIENEITFSSTFDENGLSKAYSILTNSRKDYLDGIDTSNIIANIDKIVGSNRYFETWEDVKKRYIAKNDLGVTTDTISIEELKLNGYSKQYKISKNLESLFIPLFEVYLKNDYVNSYFLDQINMGGTEFFKGAVDRIKRRQGAYSPGLKGLVNDEIGMPKSFYMAVIEDPVRKLEDDVTEDSAGKNYLFDLLVSSGVIKESLSLKEKNDIYKKFVDKFDKFNPTDAQGYMLPERASELQKGFGESYQIGNVLKPAHYEIDKYGVPRMVKYSAIVLTDELVNNFPELGHLRNKMRNAKDNNGNSRPVGEIVYHTAFKVGAPKKRLSMNLFEDNDIELDHNSVVRLSNERYKLQLNPEHDLDSEVAKPTQLFYFLKILNTNIDSANKVYQSLANIMQLELDAFKTKFLDSNNNFKVKEFTDYLMIKGASSTTEVYHEILAELYNEVALKSGRDIKPWNFPGIEDKIITQFSSTLQNDIVQTKFKGSKLVLMSQTGANLAGKERLKYKEDENGNLYAEVYLPKGLLNEELQKRIESNGFATLFHLPELLGFRIPSSELHSGVPIRIAGFHDMDSNIIIAPEELVPLHGSDFDVDALFVIIPETNGNDPVGYKIKNKELVFQSFDDFEKTLEGLDEKSRTALLKKYYKNQVSNEITKVISNKENRDRMISPISMKEVQSSIAKIFNDNSNLDPSGSIDESSAIDKQKVHSSSMNGRDGTGIFANFAKGLAYILHTSSNTENPLLLKQLDGLPYFTNSLPLNTLKDVRPLWEVLDSLLNAAIDNVKEQILPKLNLNGTTIPTYAMMLGLGMDLDTANKVMVQPIIKHISGISGRESKVSKGIISANTILKRKFSEVTNKTPFMTRFLLGTLTDEDIILSDEDLNYAISTDIVSNPNITINDIIDIRALEIQAKILENYKRTEKIVTEFNKIVRYLSIVRDLPVFSNKIYELLELKNEIWNDYGKTLDSFPINVDNFFESNPHITKSDEVLQLQKSLLEKNFFKHNSKIQDFFSNLGHITFDVNKFTDLKYKQDEFVKFVYSSLYFTKENNKVEPYNYKINKLKFGKQLLDQEAFVQHFVNKIRILKEIYPDNYFVKRFSTLSSSYSEDLKQLAFYLDNKVTPLDKAEFENAFKELSKYNIYTISKEEYDKIKDSTLKHRFNNNYYRSVTRDLRNDQDSSPYSDLQKEFVEYNILTEGMRNSSSSYAQLLPGFIYRNQYYEYENTMARIINDFTLKELSNLYDVFNSNITITNTDKMLDFKEKYEFRTPSFYSIKDENANTVYFDLSTASTEASADYIKIKHPIYKTNFQTAEEQEAAENEESKIDQFNEDGVDFAPKKPDYYQTKLYKKVYSTNEKSYYQLVSIIRNNKIYKGTSEIFKADKKDESAVYNRFSPNYFNVKYTNIDGNKIELANEPNSNFLIRNLKNDLPTNISISDVKDSLRLDTKFVQIKSFDPETRILVFKEIAQELVPKAPLINENIRLRNSGEAIKIDSLNNDSFNLGSDNQTLDQVLGKVEHFMEPTHYRLLELLTPYIDTTNTKVVFNQKLGKKVRGNWNREGNSKTINLSNTLKNKSELSHTFTHELLHHVVYDILHKNENLLTTNQKEAKRRLEALYRATKDIAKSEGKNTKNTYGLTNLDEFISEAWSNKEFQQWLSSKKINKKTIWTRFKEAIIKIFDLEEDNLLYNVINTTLELINDNNPLTDDNEVSVSMSLRESVEEPFVEIRSAAESIGFTLGKDNEGNENSFYSSNVMDFNRSTNDLNGYQTWFIKNYNWTRYKKGTIIFDAEKAYKDVPEGETIYQESFSKNLTKEEYIAERERVKTESQIRGKMTEALVNYYITNNQEKRQEVIDYINQLPKEISDKVLLLDDMEIIKKIVLNKMESNLMNNDGSKIDFSIPTFSKALKRGGTIDTMIKHPDGEYSLFDIKTSQFLSETNFTKMFGYGQTSDFNIVSNDRNKAKLQIMFYALMVRLNNPNVKFKKLSILHLPVTTSKDKLMKLLDANTASDDIVEVKSFLPMIQAFLKDTKQQIVLELIKEGDKSLYEQLEEEYKANGGSSIEDLFNPRKYFNYYSPNNANVTDTQYGQELLTKKSQEERILEEILLLDSTEKDSLKMMNPTKDKVKIFRNGQHYEVTSLEKYRKERLKQLVEEWIRLTGDTDLVYLSTKDIDFVHLNFGSNKDMDNNPIFSTWNKFKFSRQNKARYAAEEKALMMRSKVDKVLPRSLPINMNSQRDLFGKFVKKEYNSLLGRNVERLVHKDLDDAEYNKLTPDEKDFINYLNDTFASYFTKGAYLNTTGSFYINNFGDVEGITHLEAYNKGKDKFEYYPGWFPKTPITEHEYQERILKENGTLEGGKKLLSNWVDRNLNKYFENLFSINEDTAAIPIKYLGNSQIEEQMLYSIKLDQVFEKFVDAIERKINLDEVYHVGRSITMLLQEDNGLTGAATIFDVEDKAYKKRYKNLIEVIEDRIDNELKDIPIAKTEYLSKEFIVGDKKIDLDKSMLLLSQGATATVMWLKPIAGIGNLLMGNIVKYREALKFSIAKGFMKSVDAKAIDYTYQDALWAEKEYAGLVKDSLSGKDKMYSNKLFLLAEKFGYLADNYRFGSNARKFKSDRNPLFSSDNMYIFHTLGEKYLSYTTLGAQLKHYTIDVDGKPVSIFDLYKTEQIPGSKYSKLVWIGPKRLIKDGNVIREVEGITDDEIYRFKVVSARMQGDYRKEEYIRLERYALGKITIVLKKFFQRLILNGIVGKTSSRALGAYKEVEHIDEQGNKLSVLEWNARDIEGKWRTLLNAMTALFRINSDVSKAGGFSEYWKGLNQEQKLNLIEVLVTVGFLIMAYGGYVLMFGDTDDNDTWKKAWKTYLIDNASQQYNFVDLLRTSSTIATPVLVKKAFDFASAGSQLFISDGFNLVTGNSEEIYTQDGNVKGLNLFLKSIPYTAFGQDFYNKLQNIDVDQYGLFNNDKLR